MQPFFITLIFQNKRIISFYLIFALLTLKENDIDKKCVIR